MKTCMRLICAFVSFLVLSVAATSPAHKSGASLRIDSDAENTVAAPDDWVDIDTPWRRLLKDAIDRAINPDDYVCNAPTAFQSWANGKASEFDLISLVALSFLGAFNAAGNATVLTDHDASDEYIGLFGEFTREQIKQHKDNQRFWDVRTDDILLMGMHGAVLADRAKMLQVLSILGVPPALAVYMIDTAQTIIEGGEVDLSLFPAIFPEYPPPFAIKYTAPGVPSGYDNPLFTLNAFAFSTGGAEIPGVGLVPDKIVMGDGVLEALVAIGLGNNAPDFVHAHEFAHHVQYEIGAIGPPPLSPERTRRAELMADAFGAYYGSHARGATFQAKRFSDVMTAAFIVGDCQFESNGHHGTPDQREAAALWGGSISDSAQKQGHIKSPAEMLALFDAELPNLVAPDAP